MILLIISFIAGVLTVLAPCVLPLLPVVVGGSLAGTEVSRKRAFVVTISLGVSVIVFTLLLKVSAVFVTIPESVWQWISGGIILVFGIIMLFPGVWEHVSFAKKLNQDSNRMMATGFKRKSFWGDVIVGASLGPVFSSCSPTYFLVLATVLPERPIVGFIYLLTYTCGMCLTLLFVALIGQRIMNAVGIAADPKGWFKRTLGILFIIVGLLIITGFEKKLELRVASSGYFDVTRIEQMLLRQRNDSRVPVSSTVKSGITFLTSAEKKANLQIAPEIVHPSGFVNTGGKPITIGEFRGKKVVLLDIWTYSCINCQRTLPYVKAWYEKYKDQGLEIISLHTPEFGFEKIKKNVEDAVRREGITYPVVLDNDYATWNAYNNDSWPKKYLIDIDGYVIYDHAGEGDYNVTEKAIQYALKERSERLNMPVSLPGTLTAPKDAVTVDFQKIRSPEIYFGSRRREPGDSVRFIGDWKTDPEYKESEGVTKIIYTYNAKNVYMVASASEGVTVNVLMDGKFFKSVQIKGEDLYRLINSESYAEHTIEIDVPKAGLRAFTFTFG